MFEVGEWAWSQAHQQHVKVIESSGLWGQSFYRVWLQQQDSIVKVRAGDLTQPTKEHPISQHFLSYISVKLKLADKPAGSTWPAFYAVSILTGIGFTMSLFVGNLAFVDNTEYMDGVKLGVLSGSLLSTLAGYFLILSSSRK
mgnify:CR=1 FL=1